MATDDPHPCGFTGKKRFPTKEDAQKALAAYGRARGSRKVQKRCPFCDGFHMTKGVRGRPGKAR